VAGAILVLRPASPIKPKVQKVLESSYWTEMGATRQLRTAAAMKIWEEAPWTGVGPQGFSHYLGTVIEDGDWKKLKEDRRYVWNDFLQLLCEWGVIGSGLLLAIVIILLIPLFVRLRNLFAGHGGDSESLKDVFLSLDAYLVPGLVAVVTLLTYGWWSSLFQYPITFLSWFFVLALLPGLLQSRQMKRKSSER
jgi:O-antigen ligase